MSTLSVPLDASLENFVNDMVRRGAAANKADVARKALRRMSEEEAINAVLQSEREIDEGKYFEGDLRELIKKIP